MSRLVLFTGKGGVGKTTTAAATAAHASRCGVRTLVASADPAHSLADALGVPLGHAPAEVAPGLFARQIDARARGERSWREVQGYLVGALSDLGVDPIAAEELTEVPGAEEVLSLLEVRDAVASGEYDLVVVDCAPSSETLRLLAMPEVLDRLVRRLLPMERRIARVLSRPLTGAGLSGVPAPADHVVEAAERLVRELAAARDVLVAPETSVRLVMTPEAVVLAETRRTWTTLALHGFRVDQVVANRVFDGAGDAWRQRRREAQDVVLAEADASFHPVPVARSGWADGEPVGVDALTAFGERLLGPVAEWSADAVLAPVPAEIDAAFDVERVDGGFVLGLNVPLARRDELELGRRGDDLVVTVSGRRRVVALPGALCRCQVAGAALRDGRLAVRFEPDPALWPVR